MVADNYPEMTSARCLHYLRAGDVQASECKVKSLCPEKHKLKCHSSLISLSALTTTFNWFFLHVNKSVSESEV